MTHQTPSKKFVLSTRQAEICALIAGGETHKAIAEQLGISEHTVEAHAERARDRIVKAHPGVIKGGSPRSVILRFYALADRQAFHHPPQEAAA